MPRLDSELIETTEHDCAEAWRCAEQAASDRAVYQLQLAEALARAHRAEKQLRRIAEHLEDYWQARVYYYGSETSESGVARALRQLEDALPPKLAMLLATTSWSKDGGLDQLAKLRQRLQSDLRELREDGLSERHGPASV